MLIAIETSSSRCSVAIGDTHFVEELANDTPREHHALVLPMVHELLERCHVALNDLDAVAFGRGPGSFTGLRIAAAFAQGLAFGAGLPVIPVSSLEALAAAANENGAADGCTHILAATDAHMGEVYWALYRRGRDALEAIDVDRLASTADWQPAALCDPLTTLFAGDAWAIYPALLPPGARGDAAAKPTARQIVRLAAAAPLTARVAPELAEPIYVRGVSVWKKIAQQGS
jgi:tRNA threonylcarbamoyladenosine biosynthesis protein TsaB